MRAPEPRGDRHSELPRRPARARSGWLLAVAALLVLAGLAGLDRGRRAGLPGVGTEDLAAGHETSDANARAIVLVGAGLAAVLVAVFVAASLLVAPYAQRPLSLSSPPGLAALPTPPDLPSPRLQTEPGQELSRYRAQQEQILHGYGWVDRSNGVVRIPIERAIDLLAQRGLPSRPPEQARQFRDRAIGSPSGPSSGRVEEATQP
jgi:hypothetical protein